MSRAWKPGDVAKINDTTGGPMRVAVCVGAGVVGEARWNYGKGAVWSSVSVARPLVVIDPEDERRIDDLQDAIIRNGAEVRWPNLQAALREFADPKPPKPAEPTGLGAVVVDSVGVTWVRTPPKVGYSSDRLDWWYSDNGACSPHWESIDAVRVLSEGVTA